LGRLGIPLVREVCGFMTSRNDSSKSTGKPAPESTGPKKPSALLDLKATEISSSEPKPPATVAGASSSTTSSSGGAKPAESKPAPAAAPSSASTQASDSKPAASPTAQASGASKPADKPTSSEKPQPDSKTATDKQAQQPRAEETAKSASKPEPQQAKAPATAQKGSGLGIVTHLTAGVAGGFLALLLAEGIGPQFGLGNHTPPQVVADLQQRLIAAEQAIRERATAPAVSPQELDQKLAELTGRLARIDEVNRAIAELSEAQAKLTADAARLGERVDQSAAAEISERVNKLEQVLATLSAAANSEEPGRIPQLAAISGKIADLEATLPNQLSELRKSVSEEIASRLAETAEASEAARSATLRMDRELAAAKADLARISQRVEALKSTDERLEQMVRAVQEEAGRLRSEVDGLRNDLADQLKTVARTQDVSAAIAPVESRIAALENNVQAVVRSEEDRRVNAERIVLALELGNLKRALDRGGPYATELSEVRRIGAGKIDLSVLERYQDRGVPTLVELKEAFRPVAHAIIDAGTVPADASTFDKLLLGAKSIVRVRRTDFAADDSSVEAIVSRMEKALESAKFAEVLDQAQQLPPRALEAAQEWLAKVEARAAVDRALASVEEQLKASLSGQASVEKGTN